MFHNAPYANNHIPVNRFARAAVVTNGARTPGFTGAMFRQPPPPPPAAGGRLLRQPPLHKNTW